MKLRRNKKGFTIIELVIVIAVIGILSAVLIPTFVNLTNKANEASDNALINNLNKALKIEEQEPGHKKAETLEGAIEDLEKQGYILENLSLKSGKELLWSQSENQFMPDPEGKTGQNYWKIVDAVPDIDDQKYSYYAGKNFNATDVTVKYGFDAGRKGNIDNIRYERSGSDSQTVSIRTTGGILTIEAGSDTVKHYGYAKILDVKAIADASYHENGTSGFVRIAKGHFVVEAQGVVNVLYATGTSAGATKVQVDNNQGIVGKAYATDDSIANEEGGVPKQAGNIVLVKDLSVTPEIISAVTKEDIAEELSDPTSTVKETLVKVVEDSSFRGEGTEEDPYLISNINELIIFRNRVNSASANAPILSSSFKLQNDIDLSSETNWTPISNAPERTKMFKGTFDGNDKVIKSLTIDDPSAKKIGFFMYAKNATFKNIKFENAKLNVSEDGAVLLGYAYGNLNIDNVHIDSASEISGDKKIGGLVGTIDNRVGDAGKTFIKNCTTAAKISTSSRAGALVANIYAWNTPSASSDPNYWATFDGGHLYYFENCTNTGALIETGTGTSGVGLVSYVNQGMIHGGYAEIYLRQESFVFKNCNNDLSKSSLTKANGNKGYYIGTYTNGGYVLIEKENEQYNANVVGGLSTGRYVIKINNNLYGYRSNTGSDGMHLPASVENHSVDFGQVITMINQAAAREHFIATSGYDDFEGGFIDIGKVYTINANTIFIDEDYNVFINDGYFAITNSRYSSYVEPFIKSGKTVDVTHSSSSTSEYTYHVVNVQ